MLRSRTIDRIDTNITAIRSGKVRYAVAMWLLGLPLPIIIIALFVRGCDW